MSNPLGTINAQHGTVNLVGRDQNITVLNYNFYSGPAPENANPQQEWPRCINDAPLDHLSVHFTGRGNELEILKQALTKGQRNSPARCAVYGMPGVGKTRLLLWFAKISSNEGLYSHIFWTSATSVDKLNQGFAKILDLVDHRDRHLHDQSAKLTSARLWLEGSYGGDIDWLLVIDNVHSDVMDFLRSHLPRSNARGKIMFTTRTAEVAEALANAAGERHLVLGLQVLDLQETTRLLIDVGIDTKTIAPSSLSKAEILVEHVGRLPLAVIHAASYMKQTGTTLDEMLTLYESEQKMELIQWENRLSSYEERSVSATFSNQFSQLDQESHDASNLLKVLSFLDPDTIPMKMIVEGAKRLSLLAPAISQSSSTSVSCSPSPPKLSPLQRLKEWRRRRGRKDRCIENQTNDLNSTSHAPSESQSLISLVLSPIKFQSAIQSLCNLSLVERRLNLEDSSLWIHDLIQFMAQESTRTEETNREWLQLSISLACSAFQHIEDHESPRSWTECEKFIPHLRSLNQAWNDVYGMNTELTEAKAKIAVYLSSRGRYGEAEELGRQALDVREKCLGADHQDTLRSMNILAVIYRLQGWYDKAETLFKQVLASRELILGTDHSDTLDSMRHLASVCHLQARYDESEALHKQTLANKERLLGADHPDTLISTGDLAMVYQSQGRYDDAEVLHKKVLSSMEKALEANHPDMLIPMNNLAVLYELQGRYNESETMHKQVLATMDKHLGADHPDTLTSMSNLASVYQSQGRYAEAESLSKRVLADQEKILGADHTATLKSMSDLAYVCQLQGRCDEAEKFQKQVLAGMEKNLGTDHPDTLISMSRLASVYQSQERYDEAEVLFKQELAHMERLFGDDHPDTLVSMNNLALVYQSQGRYNEAEVLHKRELSATEKLLGGDHPDTLVSMSNLASVCKLQGRYEEAETLYKQVLDHRENLLGTDHPETLVSIGNLAWVYQSQGRYDEAMMLRKQVVACRERLLGAEHPDTLKAMKHLESVYQSQGSEETRDQLTKDFTL